MSLQKAHAALAFWLFLPATIVRTAYRHVRGTYPAWQTFRVAILIQTVKLLLWSKYTLYLPGPHPAEWTLPKPITPLAKQARRGMEVERVVLDPIGSEMRRGVADVSQVEAVSRPAWMIWTGGRTKDQGVGLDKAVPGEKVLFYLHSGAYVFGHPLETAFAWSMARDLSTRVFAVNYRKTLSAETAHPAPLLDALAGWVYLTRTLNFDPDKITIVGDSAGGHLALLLSRYLDSLALPLPGRLALCSPWCDFTFTATNPTFPSQIDNEKYDYVPYLGDKSVVSGMRHYPKDMIRSEWYSPALATPDQWTYLVKNNVRVYVMRGTKELLADEIAAAVEGMKAGNVDVQLRDDMDGIHIGPSVPWPGSSSWKTWIKDLETFVA